MHNFEKPKLEQCLVPFAHMSPVAGVSHVCEFGLHSRLKSRPMPVIWRAPVQYGRRMKRNLPFVLFFVGSSAATPFLWGAVSRYVRRSMSERQGVRTQKGGEYNSFHAPVSIDRHWVVIIYFLVRSSVFVTGFVDVHSALQSTSRGAGGMNGFLW